MTSGDASSSICPKGWRLPKGTPGIGTNEFAVVVGLTSVDIAKDGNFWSSLSSPSFANNALTVNDVTWPAAGHYFGSSSNSVGSFGGYWSSTAYSGSNAYDLDFYSNLFRPAYANYKYNGYSVRCVAR